MPDIQTKPLCFVIMPFKKEYDEIYETIKKAGEFADFDTQRADENYAPGKIPDRIQNLMDLAPIIIAEISEMNPNVYYELGLAHANKKTVILICKEDSEIPIDIQHWNHKSYHDLSDLKKKLWPILIDQKEKLDTELPEEKVKALSPMDIELGELAVKCKMIEPWVLEKRLEELKAEGSRYENISELLLSTNDIDKEQAEVLLQAQKWVSEYFNSVSKSLKESTWINRIHRTVNFTHWQNKFHGSPPAKKRYIPILNREVDIYDEAIYTDYIIFQKFTEATFNAWSTGIVLLQEADTGEYSISIADSSRKYYKHSGGKSLEYNISAKEEITFPLIVNRTFTFINGFQRDDEDDNREIGLEIKEPTGEVRLIVDFSMLPVKATKIVAELRMLKGKEELEIKKSSHQCYYTTKSYPPKGSSLYIKWKWEEESGDKS